MRTKMYSAIDVPFIEWGMASYFITGFANATHSPLPYAPSMHDSVTIGLECP
jgi:hypothetical protein